MTVKIDGVEPNIFPDVDDLDARDAGRNVEVFLDVIVDGKPTPVTVKLSYEQAGRFYQRVVFRVREIRGHRLLI
jgi:hypothetical protein